MPAFEANPSVPRNSTQRPTGAQFSLPLHSPCGSPTNLSPLPPPLTTAAATTQQPVVLRGWSTFWQSNITRTLNAQPILSAGSVPAILAYPPPSLDIREEAVDLAASAGSVPSTTTTLTNTLPATQSAALRALNAPAFHSSLEESKPAKSASSHSTIISQPVVVRTYSGTPRSSTMAAHANASILSAGLVGKSDRLPSADDFSFSAILRAVDPEIRGAIDAIAEICARSRMSLADEYDAHLPPQGEITTMGPGWAASTGALVGRGRLSRVAQGWTAADNTLTAVPEASSSTERLAQEDKVASSGSSRRRRRRRRRSQSAYGSLKSFISSASGKRITTNDDACQDAEEASSMQVESRRYSGPAWIVHASSTGPPSIKLKISPKPSKQLDTSSGLNDVPKHPDALLQMAVQQNTLAHPRGVSFANLPTSRTHSGIISSLSSWPSRPRSLNVSSSSQQEWTRAEGRLRELLQSSRQHTGKGKDIVGLV